MGAAGRDFHNFNVFFRNNPLYRVVCFTSGQLPIKSERIYPPDLSGQYYPDGIPIRPESELLKILKEENVDLVVFSYSDVSHQYVMEWASKVMAEGASFILLGPKETMIESSKPVISVCAVRTGSGKSPTTRRVASILRSFNLKPAIIRHPMPYGVLSRQVVEKFELLEDLDKYNCTIEEREDFTHLIKAGFTVYAGVDYERILRLAEEDADIIIWDGGNNDYPFIKPDLKIVVADPFRVGHETTYYPGMVNLLMADVVVINKVNTAEKSNIDKLVSNVKHYNSRAKIVFAESTLNVKNPEDLKDKRVVAIEDGPTITHGGMPYGAGYLAAKKFGATIVDPRKYAVGMMKTIYEEYPHIGPVLPAVGYSSEQIKELEKTINRIDCDLVVSGTPIDLNSILNVNKPVVQVTYGIKEVSKPDLKDIIEEFLKKRRLAR